MAVQITLTQAALAQAKTEAEIVLGQAYGELDRRPWGEPTSFAVHVFTGPGGDYIMYPLTDDHIEVDSCFREEMGPLDLPDDHPLSGKAIKIPRKATE